MCEQLCIFRAKQPFLQHVFTDELQLHEVFGIHAMKHLLLSPYSIRTTSLQARIANFKWQPAERFFGVVGNFDTSNSLHSGFIQADFRNAILKLGGQACITSHDSYTILLVGMGEESSRQPFLEVMAELFEKIPAVCYGPVRSRLEGASASLRAAVNGFKARFAYLDHPNPMRAEDLLAERALFGDVDAQDELYDKVYAPMKREEHKTQILSTLKNYLFTGFK